MRMSEEERISISTGLQLSKKTIAGIGSFIVIIIICSLIIYSSHSSKPEKYVNTCELEKDIYSGKSIMGLWPHPDDEVYTPGIFPFAKDKGCKIWVVTLVSLESIPEKAKESRLQAIEWFEEQYLEEYINLGMRKNPESGGWHGWTWSYEEIKAQYKAQIEEKQPDILLTFSPYGFGDLVEHARISNMISEIWEELTYEPKPKIYWFINTNQGPRLDKHNESELYPPTDILDLSLIHI